MLALECSSSEQVTLALSIVLTCESLEVEVGILGELSKVQSLPIEASLLLLYTLVVTVVWGCEFSGVKPVKLHDVSMGHEHELS